MQERGAERRIGSRARCSSLLILSLSPSRASLVPRVRGKVCGMKIDAIRGRGDKGNQVENGK